MADMNESLSGAPGSDASAAKTTCCGDFCGAPPAGGMFPHMIGVAKLAAAPADLFPKILNFQPDRDIWESLAASLAFNLMVIVLTTVIQIVISLVATMASFGLVGGIIGLVISVISWGFTAYWVCWCGKFGQYTYTIQLPSVGPTDIKTFFLGWWVLGAISNTLKSINGARTWAGYASTAGTSCARLAKIFASSKTYKQPAYCSGTWGYYVVALMSILVAVSMVPMVAHSALLVMSKLQGPDGTTFGTPAADEEAPKMAGTAGTAPVAAAAAPVAAAEPGTAPPATATDI